MKNKYVLGIIISLILLILLWVSIYRFVLDIRYQSEIDILPKSAAEDKPVVYFGVISRYSPQHIYQGYQPIMDYLSAQTPHKFELRLSNSYNETVQQLVTGEVELAFLGSYIYVRDREQFDLQCVLKPLNEDGHPYFYSQLVTADSSSIFSIHDLKDKRLALPSPESFSGNWLPSFALKNLGMLHSDLSSIQHFPYHQTVANQILMGHFDAGVVKDAVAKHYIHKGLRVIALSDPIPGSPIVVRKNHKQKLVKEIVDALLQASPDNPALKGMLSNWDREFSNGFVVAKAADYQHLDSMIQVQRHND